MALGSHLITVRRLEKYINDVIGKKANLPDTSKTIIGNISQINSDLSHTYFQLASSGSVVNIEQQDCWRQGNRVHIAFSATASIAMPKDNVWAIVPTEYRRRGTRTCGYVLIDDITGAYINSVMVDGVESGYVYQKWTPSVPANTRVTFIADYFI